MQTIKLGRALLAIIVLNSWFTASHEEVFTALADLETLVNVEGELLSMLKVYVNFVEVRVKEISHFVNKMKNQSDYALQDKTMQFDKFSLNNPLGVVTLFGRCLYKWSDIRHTLREVSSVGKDFRSYFKRKRSSHGMPGLDDLYGAASAIFRLQSVYRLDARSVLRGNSYLSAKNLFDIGDILELGKAAYYEKKMKNAKEWLDIVLDGLLQNPFGSYNAKYEDLLVEVREYLAVAEYDLGDIPRAWSHTSEILKLDPKHERALANLKVIRVSMKKSKKGDGDTTKVESVGYNSDLYEGLCRGDRVTGAIRKEKYSKHMQLSCGYKKDSPELIIKPTAFEILSTDPEIKIFYNVVGDHDIDLIKKLAYPKLMRATVNNVKTGISQIADYRISKSGWLSDNEHEVIKKISQRLEVVTGLASNTAEELQVANYGIGGHYDPHFDWARNFPTSDLKAYGQGNRIATALLYMSDVEAGGGTAFLSPRVTVWPKKGSVAFWYNLFRNGTGKITTQHAACPVLLGSKWVANKWFHEYGQEFTRPCSLNRWE